MIRINLLRPPQRPTIPTLTLAESQVQLVAGVMVLLAVLVMGWWYWLLQGNVETARSTVEELQLENTRLQAVQAEQERFLRQNTLLEERIDVIERLKSNQKGPVLLMNAVIASIPEEPRLWLTSLAQHESEVKIEGRALDVPAVADFIANLSLSPPFRHVELDYWEEDQGSIKFELSGEIGS